MTDSTPDPSSSAPGAEIRIVSGSPTTEEVAAITAVLHATLDELAANEAVHAKLSTTAWQRSQRQLRGNLQSGPGVWRGFSA